MLFEGTVWESVESSGCSHAPTPTVLAFWLQHSTEWVCAGVHICVIPRLRKALHKIQYDAVQHRVLILAALKIIPEKILDHSLMGGAAARIWWILIYSPTHSVAHRLKDPRR